MGRFLSSICRAVSLSNLWAHSAQILLLFILVFSSFRPEAFAQEQNPFTSNLSQARLQEEIEREKSEEYASLPGGVFHAPELYAHMEKALKRLMTTRMVEDDIAVSLFLASTPEVNGWIREIHTITDVKVFHIVMTKGIIDLFSDPEVANRILGPELAERILENSEAVLAAVLAHELGHAMNGDTANTQVSTRIHNEFDADHFAAETISEAGYDPEAAILMLEALGKLSEDQSLAQLIGRILDEHPKPNFRIAHISEIVSDLRRRSEARESLGFDPTMLDSQEPRAINREGIERPSRTSVDGFKRELIRTYSGLDLSTKLRFLERYLTEGGGTEISGMTRKTAVRIAEEYLKIIEGIETMGEVDKVAASLKQFEGNIGRLAGSISPNPEDNVKRALTNVKEAITQKQLEVLGVENINEISLKDLVEIGRELDKRVLFGQLMARVYRAETLPEIEDILNVRVDRDHSFQERFLRQNSSTSVNYSNYLESFYEAVGVRVLAITRDMSETLDFVQKNFMLEKTEDSEGETAAVPAAHYVFAGWTRYLLSNADIEIDRFSERMNNPLSRSDRVFNRMIANYRDATTEVLLDRRGRIPEGNIQSRDFRYGVGRPFQLKTELTPAHVELFLRLIGSTGLKTISGDLIKTRFTRNEVLTLLSERSQTPDLWESLKTEQGNSGAPRELQYHLIQISRELEDQGVAPLAVDAVDAARKSLPLPGGASEESREIYELYVTASQVLTSNIIGVLRSFGSSEYISVIKSDTETVRERAEVPRIRDQIVSNLTSDDRLTMLDEMAQIVLQPDIKEYGGLLISSRPVFEEGLQDLESEGKIPDGVREEFLEDLDEFIDLVQKKLEDETYLLPEEYFILRRRLLFKYKILNTSYSSYRSTLTSSAIASIEKLIGLSRVHFHKKNVALPLVNSLLVRTENETVSYLKDQSDAAIRNLEISSDMARTMAFYNGIGSLCEENCGFERNEHIRGLVARKIHSPAIPYLKSMKKADGYDDIVKTKPIFDDSIQFPESALEDLVPVSEAYLELIRWEEERTENVNLMSRVIAEGLEDLWSLELYYSTESKSAIDSLVFTLSYIESSANSKDEKVARLHYTLLMRALRLVKSKEEMQLYVGLLAIYLEGHNVGPTDFREFLSANLEDLANVNAARYREHFYDELTNKVNEFDAWGANLEPTRKLKTDILVGFAQKITHSMAATYKWGPLFFRLPFLKDAVWPFVREQKWFENFRKKLLRNAATIYTQALLDQEFALGEMNREEFFQNARSNTPWSIELDKAIAEYIKEGDFEGFYLTQSKKRETAITLLKSIRSLTIREKTYQFILDEYGYVRPGWIEKGKAYWALYVAYKAAEDIWTEEVLEDLKQAKSMFAAFKIKEQAWFDFVAERASVRGVSKVEADQLLLDLYHARQRAENPVGGEVAEIFLEGSAHRDGFLEDFAKNNSMDFESLEMLEAFKSRNSETPYHNVAKAFFEMIDEYVQRLEPEEQAQVALYLGGIDSELDVGLEAKIQDLFYGTENRRKAIRSRGVFFRLDEIKMFFKETHPSEKLVAFRALFVSGISKSREAEQLIIDRILFADQNMPEYLRKVLNIYLGALTDSERSTMLSWLLANNSGETMNGPDVVRFIVERGGVVAKKLAQLISSHGFNLPPEYQEVLEVFKGRAQVVDKLEVLKWIADRLPEDKFSQIKSIDKELGSGSLKVGYLATLRDGRQVVIMVTRPYIVSKTYREFEVLQEVVSSIMADPDLRIDNLPALSEEVERIIREEINIRNEAQLMRQHEESRNSRPLIVKWFGNETGVQVPQPLEGWYNDDIMVEEYVNAASWEDLPATSVVGWSKEKLAKSAINEILNQLLAYTDENAHHDGQVILDIDPHEENQLARSQFWFFRGKMVNIDLGQSVKVAPHVVRGFLSVVHSILFKNYDQAIERLHPFMNITTQEDLGRVKEELQKQAETAADPIETLIEAIETVELEGIGMKPEYLFFQKLFATIVGLKKHVRDRSYVLKQGVQILGLRSLRHPSVMLQEAQMIMSRDCVTALSVSP